MKTKTNQNDSAFETPDESDWSNHPGLTKLEFFAGFALLGLMNKDASNGKTYQQVSDEAVTYAKYLISSLNKLKHDD